MRSIWHGMPRLSFALLLAGIFLIFLPIGFLTDVGSLGGNSPMRLAGVVAFSGCIAVGFFYAIRRDRRFLPIVVAIQVLFVLASTRVPLVPLTAGGALRARMAFDAIASGAANILAYTCFMLFFRREGSRYFRAHAEIELAHEIHQLLVPRIDARIGRFEFCGASLPSGEVGGDLVDLVMVGDARWIGYIADVSGHGVGSGVLMGMVKSAARMTLLTVAPLAALLDDLNDAHVPVAMFEGSRYASEPVSCAPGDLFDALVATARAHGEQTDDRTVLIVRAS